MKPDEFDIVVDEVLSACFETLRSKGEEYSRNDDRLWNFKVAAALGQETPEKALWGMMAKHIVSIRDIVDAPNAVSEAMFYEKTQDTINYLILLTGLMVERRGWK